MPLTFAHPAAVLPFPRNSKYVNFLALVLGSMAPDFEYFLRGRPAGEFGHTFIGFFTFNLPVVLIVYFLYMVIVHRVLFAHLPSFLQEIPPRKPSSGRLLQVAVFLYSTLFGMLTHVTWDAFTHAGGFFVTRLQLLTYEFGMGTFVIPVFKLLQHGGTIIGIALIIGYVYVRAQRNRYKGGESIAAKQKWLYWLSAVLLAIALFCLWYLLDAVSLAAYGIIVVRLIDSGLIGLLVVSMMFSYFRKERHEKG